MKFWFDTEFIEDGRTIDLISIGIVAEDDREFYAESSDCDLSKAGEWVKENVLPQLVYRDRASGQRLTRRAIAAEILEFVGSKPEFWAYYSAYDWVALCQL